MNQIVITRGDDSDGEVCHSFPDVPLLQRPLQAAFCSGVAVSLQQSPVLLLSHRQQGAQAARITTLNELFQLLRGKKRKYLFHCRRCKPAAHQCVVISLQNDGNIIVLSLQLLSSSSVYS